MDAFATCDEDFLAFLRQAITSDETRWARISRIDTPSPAYTCGCGVPAEWYVARIRRDAP